MSLPDDGFLREGHLLLRWASDVEPDDGDRLVDLTAHADSLTDWWACGAHSGVRALASLGERSAGDLGRLTLSARGAGCELPAAVASALGFGTVHAGDQHVPGRSDHFALLGCGGQLPVAEECRQAAQHLLPEGWLTLYGLPHGQLSAAFESLAEGGFVLRSSGRIDEWAYLSGSILRLAAFLQ